MDLECDFLKVWSWKVCPKSSKNWVVGKRAEKTFLSWWNFFQEELILREDYIVLSSLQV